MHEEHEDIALEDKPARFYIHHFTDAALPENTWRIEGDEERIRWANMHLKRDASFAQRLKSYENKTKRTLPRVGDRTTLALDGYL